MPFFMDMVVCTLIKKDQQVCKHTFSKIDYKNVFKITLLRGRGGDSDTLLRKGRLMILNRLFFAAAKFWAISNLLIKFHILHLTLVYMGGGGKFSPQTVFWLQLKNGWR